MISEVNMNNIQNSRRTGRRPDKKAKFPVPALIVLLISFFVLIYCTVSIIVFVTSINANDQLQQTATAAEESDTEPIERGNLQFTVKELFDIEDTNSTKGTIFLYALCTLALGSLVAIVFSYRSIVKSGASKSVKTLLIIVGTVAAILIGALLTYELYKVQLDWFRSEKDASSGQINATTRDVNGNYYILDGNKEPFLMLEMEDEISNEKYLSVSSSLGLNDIDYLYVRCDYTATEGTSIRINSFYIENGDGEKKTLDLTCESGSNEREAYYILSESGILIRYKLLNGSTGERSDLNALTTFLIVGKDRVGLNTDVMMLVSMHEDEGKYSAEILQIPRDTYCRDNSSNNKINAVYGTYYRNSEATDENGKITDGMNGLVGMLERNLLIKIDYWAIMNLDGFGDIVDGIGGVDMYVPFDMKYNDPTANPPLKINLKEGQQTLYGDQAEQFIRYRKGYVTGDLGRVDATKIFLTAFFCKLREELSITNPAAIASTVSTLIKYVTTNLDAGNAVYYVKKVLKLTLEDITFLNVPGTDAPKAPNSELSYYTSNRKGLYFVINTYFNVYDDDINEKEFDASRMFTTQQSGTDLDRAHNGAFDEEAYVNSLKGADEIKQDQDNGVNNLPTVRR